MSVVQYNEGELVALPLKGGGVGVALVARWSRAHRRGNKVLFLYGFGRTFETQPTLDVAARFKPADAVNLSFQGDRAITTGRWLRLGRMPGFSYEAWPMPLFCSRLRSRVQLMSFDNETLDLVQVDPRMLRSDELAALPEYYGLGNATWMESGLSAAIKEAGRGDTSHRTVITAERLESWKTSIQRVRA